MSFKIFAGSTSLAALAMASVACSSSDNAPAGPSNPDGGGGAATGGSSSGGASGEGGTSGKGGSGGGGGTSDASTEGSTSCGDVPVLGDFWSSVPAECTSCMASKCCSELGACGSDTTCSTYRKCLDACSQSDGTCQSACLPDSGSPTGSNAITTCRVDNCDACANLSCMGTAWPAPATAHDISMHATLTNFSTG
jgi:hypothetical protein